MTPDEEKFIERFPSEPIADLLPPEDPTGLRGFWSELPFHTKVIYAMVPILAGIGFEEVICSIFVSVTDSIRNFVVLLVYVIFLRIRYGKWWKK